jgi:hypothetical protein
MECRESYRLAKGEEAPAKMNIYGKNTTFDLDWVLMRWQADKCKFGEGGIITENPRIQFNITYRDQADNWYKSVCEFGRDVLVVQGGIFVRYISRERIPKPTETASGSISQALGV